VGASSHSVERTLWTNQARDACLLTTALEHVILLGLSVVLRLRKTATEPAEFSGPNTTTLLYAIVGIHALINVHEYHCIAIRMRCWLMDDFLSKWPKAVEYKAAP
jgi:hypothetical protein